MADGGVADGGVADGGVADGGVADGGVADGGLTGVGLAGGNGRGGGLELADRDGGAGGEGMGRIGMETLAAGLGELLGGAGAFRGGGPVNGGTARGGGDCGTADVEARNTAWHLGQAWVASGSGSTILSVALHCGQWILAMGSRNRGPQFRDFE